MASRHVLAAGTQDRQHVRLHVAGDTLVARHPEKFHLPTWTGAVQGHLERVHYTHVKLRFMLPLSNVHGVLGIRADEDPRANALTMAAFRDVVGHRGFVA